MRGELEEETLKICCAILFVLVLPRPIYVLEKCVMQSRESHGRWNDVAIGKSGWGK